MSEFYFLQLCAKKKQILRNRRSSDSLLITIENNPVYLKIDCFCLLL